MNDGVTIVRATYKQSKSKQDTVWQEWLGKVILGEEKTSNEMPMTSNGKPGK